MQEIENRMVVDSEWRKRGTIVAICDECDGEIREGDSYYELDNEVVCDGCLDGYLKQFRRIG